MALIVANYGDSDGRTGLLGSDEHTFHRAFLGGDHLPRQSGQRLSLSFGLGLFRSAEDSSDGQNRDKQ